MKRAILTTAEIVNVLARYLCPLHAAEIYIMASKARGDFGASWEDEATRNAVQRALDAALDTGAIFKAPPIAGIWPAYVRGNR